MLRALLTAAIDDRADRDRRGNLAAEHRSPLGCLRDDLVHRQQHEVDARMYDDGAVAAEGGTERGAGRRQLGDGGVDHPLATELAVEIRHRVTDVPRAPEPLADRENRGMVRQEILEPVADGGSVSRRHRCALQGFFAMVPLYTRLSNAFAGG